MALVKASEWLPSFFGEGTSLLDRFFKDDFFDWSKFNFASKTLPAVNVKETDDKFTLEMAAPGLSKDILKPDRFPKPVGFSNLIFKYLV